MPYNHPCVRYPSTLSTRSLRCATPALLCSALLCSALLLTLTGCGKGDKPNPPDGQTGGPTVPPPGPTDPPKPPTDPGAELKNAKPELTTTATDWATQIEKNASETVGKYTGKVIELSGVVASVGNDPISGASIVRLKGKNDISCAVPDAWEKVSEGMEVTVRGKVGTLADGRLDSAVIVKAGTNPIPNVAATDLAKQFKADSKAANAKFDGKNVYVEGEVLEGGKADKFVIKGDGEMNITCTVPGLNPQAQAVAQALKPGQKVKALGELHNYDKGLQMNFTLFKVQ